MGFKSAIMTAHAGTPPPLPPGIAGNSRRQTSIPLVASARLPSSNRLTQSTLHKIFALMLLIVFIMYAILMICFVRQNHTDAFQSEGKWGPSIAASDQVRRDHWQNMKLLEEEEMLKRDDERPRKQKVPQVVTIDYSNADAQVMSVPRKGPANNAADFEAFDIHDMQPPPPDQNQQHKQQQQQKNQYKNNNLQEKTANKIIEPMSRVLTAFLEPFDPNHNDWKTKPLPIRTTTAEQLTAISYPRVDSCSKLVEQWPIDDYPGDSDPFLPWIHDVFPTDDGKFIQFVAQNKRRCRTGTTPEEIKVLEQMQPQVALFQHVPIKRVTNSNSNSNDVQYQLTSHEEADPDGIETRFICKFHPSGQETLSVFNVNYDYAATRKGHRKTFSEEGRDNKSIHTSQLIFQCPVPADLVDTVRDGTSVLDDKATMFLSLVPIRTPPRYGAPNRFLPPHYQENPKHNNFTVSQEWGEAHVLPSISNSGRWENIPICLPTYKAFPKVSSPPPPPPTNGLSTQQLTPQQRLDPSSLLPASFKKRHRLVAATWASAGYATRGERFAIRDGARRLDEWIRFHLLVGVDHVIVYDNSHGDDGVTLESVTSQFSDEQVTRVPWPAAVCNNNRSFADSPGERSSQYAAESSWRLRFGPHTDWMASMDVDEYIVPVGEYTSLKPFLDQLDAEHTKIISFGSWRSWPRRDLIAPPIPIKDRSICDEPLPCFELQVPAEHSILQTYNCDRQVVKTEKMPAEKQIYRPDYVMQHFVHYSTITQLAQMNKSDTEAAGHKFGRMSPDPLSRFANEQSEVTMLHTKAIATQDTAGWETRCKGLAKRGWCRIGVPFPNNNNDDVVAAAGTSGNDASTMNVTKDEEGWLYNCYTNRKIEEYWVPRLDEALKDSQIVHPIMTGR